MPTVKPISDLQRNMGDIARECAETKKPIYLTKNGTASLVIMDAAAFDEEMKLFDVVYERESRVHGSIMRGLEDVRCGRIRPLEQALRDASEARDACKSEELQHG